MIVIFCYKFFAKKKQINQSVVWITQTCQNSAKVARKKFMRSDGLSGFKKAQDKSLKHFEASNSV